MGHAMPDSEMIVLLPAKLKRPKKIPQRSPEKNLRKINVERLPPFKPWKSISILQNLKQSNSKKIVSLESDSSTLAQTLELIQQEKASLSSKLLEMRTYFTKVGEEINAKLQEQQDWSILTKLAEN
nr:hypothetical protein CFP56_75205 [Quercus suber]